MTDAASILSAIRPVSEYSNDDIALPIFFLRTLFALRLLPGQEVFSQLHAFAQRINFMPPGLQAVPVA